MDEYGARSQQRAMQAVAEGRFDREIVPVVGSDGSVVERDEGIRDSTIETLSKLQPAFRPADAGRTRKCTHFRQMSFGSRKP